MCRSIKQLRRPASAASDAQPITETEITAAALQYVRKVSGYRAPSRANQTVFEQAVADVARATSVLLAGLKNLTPPAPLLPSAPLRGSPTVE